jgi:mannose-6-phosphate isomerase-like protein (cupin superfamily)
VNVSPDRLPARIEKPWGYEIWYAWTERYVGKILHVRRGHRLSLQYHRQKDEASYLLRGRLRLTKGPAEDWRMPTSSRSPRPSSTTSSA